jgi:hypothetical protein
MNEQGEEDLHIHEKRQATRQPDRRAASARPKLKREAYKSWMLKPFPPSPFLSLSTSVGTPG